MHCFSSRNIKIKMSLRSMICVSAITILHLVFQFSGSSDVYLTEGQTVKLSCPPNKTATIFDFSVILSGTFVNLATCFRTCVANNGLIFINNTQGYFITADIVDLAILRNISKVMCRYDEFVTEYNVIVIALPLNSSCEVPNITPDKLNVALKCKTTKVYPQARCSVKIRNTTITYGSVNYTHTQLPGTTVYYQSECTWTLPLSNFESGSVSFDVVLYPWNTTDTFSGITTLSIPAMNLSLPNVTLSTDCFNGRDVVDGYLKPGATSYCLCYLNDIGHPDGYVKWQDKHFNDVGTKVNSTATHLLISPASDGKTFFCLAITSLKNGNISISYSVLYANNVSNHLLEAIISPVVTRFKSASLKGPSKCEIHPEQTEWNQCNNSAINITTSCEVEKSNVLPGVKSKFYVNNMQISNITINQLTSNKYIAKTFNTITSTGNLSFSCEVQNSEFKDVTAICYQAVYITSPPTAPPVIKIGNFTTVAAVQENKVYIISCYALGGTPSVSNISVMCGNNIVSTQSGKIFNASLQFTRNLTGLFCTCSAEHVSGCYVNNTSQILLNVLYLSTVKIFKTQNNTSFFDNGTHTELNCEADGNPSPIINIIKGNNILFQNVSGHYLSANKSLTCRDTGKYICQADNQGLQEISTEYVFIYVKCPLQFVNMFETQFNFTQFLGENLYSSINIYGYPEPNNFRLLKYDLSSKLDEEIQMTINLDYFFTCCEDKIIVKYYFVQLPFCTVEIKIRNLTALDFTNYSLLIIQNKNSNLKFNFCIKEVIKASSKRESSSPSVAAIIGGTVSGLALVAIIVVVIIMLKKYEIHLQVNKRKTDINKNNTNYTELSVTTVRDEHSYATLKIDSNAYSNIQVNTNHSNIQQTCNMNPSSSTSYCNTNDLHLDFTGLNPIIEGSPTCENTDPTYVKIVD